MKTVVPATAQDVQVWSSLRRDGITRYPEAFLLSLAQHDASDPATDAERLAGGGKFISYSADTPVGMIGLNPYSLSNMRHRAEVGPLYVIPDAQGSCAAHQLMQAAAVMHRRRAIGSLN